jgi:hypothetical protein
MDALVKGLLKAYDTGSVMLIVSAMLMIVVFVVSAMFKDNVPKKFKPLFVSVLGVVSAVAGALLLDIEWYMAVTVGVLLGTSAGGHWSLWGKYVCNVVDPDG